MRFRDIYLCCSNLINDSDMTVLEEGKNPVEAKLEDIYDEICDRQVIWFFVEKDYKILIQLKEE